MAALSPTQIGAEILKATADGNKKALKAIGRAHGKSTNLKQICDLYNDFATGRRAIHLAAEKGNLEIVTRLVERFGAFVDIPSYCGDTPLIEAAREGHINVVEFLISHKAQLQAANKKGFTALHYAVQKDNRDLMELLLNNGAPTEKDSVDGTPLQIAASRGQIKSIKLLLKYGAEPNSNISEVQDSPLISAIKALSYECVKRLIKAKADPDKFLYGLTPLAHAAKLPDTKYLECLIAAGATPDKQCTGRTIAIEEAAMVDNRKAVSILFPLTAKLTGYQTWTVDGIMKYNRSGPAKTKREAYKKRYLGILEGLGNSSSEKEDYPTALKWYNEAVFLEPDNVRWLSMRSMCYANMGNGVLAARDALESIKRNPQKCPCRKPHYAVGDHGLAWQLFKRYHMASMDFILTPDNIEYKDAYRVALFEYFSWLYLTSCPGEIMIYFQHFM
ncbi:ankyrin-1-like [Salvia hispanica]|uniref:ankyrin-1-like n=1 Tax=Salvia hispanica TaxID=49212 RepID=UPI002009AA33|nr:ankyrin-1-like [Salvia hispanica]